MRGVFGRSEYFKWQVMFSHGRDMIIFDSGSRYRRPIVPGKTLEIVFREILPSSLMRKPCRSSPSFSATCIVAGRSLVTTYVCEHGLRPGVQVSSSQSTILDRLVALLRYVRPVTPGKYWCRRDSFTVPLLFSENSTGWSPSFSPTAIQWQSDVDLFFL